MVKIRMINSVAGDGYSYGAGEEPEVAKARADDLVRGGHAELVRRVRTERAVKRTKSEKAVK